MRHARHMGMAFCFLGLAVDAHTLARARFWGATGNGYLLELGLSGDSLLFFANESVRF